MLFISIVIVSTHGTLLPVSSSRLAPSRHAGLVKRMPAGCGYVAVNFIIKTDTAGLSRHYCIGV